MEAFVARQPIFSPGQEVVAYELLFRSGLQNVFPERDPNEASARVMSDSALLMELETISNGKPAFINITREILVGGLATLLPRELVVLEILESIQPDDEVIEASRRLKEAGYHLALDDFAYDPRYRKMMELVDIIKVDFRATVGEERRRSVERVGGKPVKLLAEKVETLAEFEQARDMGYVLFQGYFFDKPQIVHAKDISGYKHNYLRLLQEIHKPELHYQELALVIRHDMALTYKLLRLINSSYFGLGSVVVSIAHAIALLGETEFKKWASFITMAGMGTDKPDALVVESLVRARFCEELAPAVGLGARKVEMFLMGLFSMLDAIADRPLPELLATIPLASDVKDALMGKEGPLRDIWQYAAAYERGDWPQLEAKAAALGISEEESPRMFRAAVSWAHESLRVIKSGDPVKA